MRIAAAALLALSASFAALVPSAAQTPPKAVDHLGMPGPITFGGERYYLAWSSKPSPSYAKHEYVTEFETVERYTRMILVERADGVDQTKAATAKIAELEARKAQDPFVTHAISRSAATGEIFLAFTLGAARGGERIVESNAYRYLAEPKGGVTLIGLSRRVYGDGDVDGRALLRRAAAGRKADLRDLAKLPAPPPAQQGR